MTKEARIQAAAKQAADRAFIHRAQGLATRLWELTSYYIDGGSLEDIPKGDNNRLKDAYELVDRLSKEELARDIALRGRRQV